MKALITLAAVLSAVFVAAPAALADAFITDTLGGNGHARSYRIITDTLGGNGHPKSTLQRYRLITDTLGGSGQPQRATLGYRFITDTLAPGGGPPLPAAPSSPGFSWSDAGIGAATAAGALFVLLGGTLLAARRRGTLAV
jgi:hypothetical protein